MERNGLNREPMNNFKYIIAAASLLISSAVSALSTTQMESILLANSIAEEYGVPIVANMVMQESSGCIDKGTDNHRSYGCMQVSIAAAKDVLKYCKLNNICNSLSFNGSTKELIHKLKTDNTFNITIGTLYMRIQLERFNGDLNRALIAYNSGYIRAKRAIDTTKYKYVRLVKMRDAQTNHPSIRIYSDYKRYVAFCKEHNQSPWNISDERNFYKHYTYVTKRYGEH